VETGAVKGVAAKTFKPAVQWDMIATLDEVKKATTDSAHYLIVDARHNLEEYTGKQLNNGLQAPGKEVTVARGGFIPTAVFSPWTKYAGNKGGEADKPTLKKAEDLKKQLEKLKKNGYAPEKTVISYCHVGLGRGSFQYLALREAGQKNVKLYVGSWHEWGNTPDLPLGTGAAAE
jgi:thiosulfate/3-mercaptopyruvate sulfurtransferase